MKQLTLIGPNKLEWQDQPEPKLSGPLGAIVRPLAVGVCDFDRAVVAGRYPALPFPIAVGHEIVAEVLELGAEVRNISLGMKVVLPLHINCGTCPSCQSKRTNSCSSRPTFSNYGLGALAGDWGGGMSDLLSLPYADAMAMPVPAGLSAAECAAVGCNLVDLHRTLVPHLSTFQNPRVLIVGGHAHNMGLYGIAIAQALGVDQIDFLDDAPHRLAAAEALGAQPILLSDIHSQKHYDIAIDCSGDVNRLTIALGHLGPDGVCTPVWPSLDDATIPAGAMFMHNARLIMGQPHARAHMDPVLALMANKKFSSTSIPTEILPWDSAAEAFGFGETKRIFVRD